MARKSKQSQKQVDGWFVVTTHQDGEFEARRHLSRQGYEVALPMMRTALNRQGVRRVIPLFEGYVFVRENCAWWSIRGTRGVSHLLMNCEKPSILEDDTLQFFVRDSVDDLGYYVDPVMRLHHVGEHVSPRSGRFAGLEGELTALDADGRIEMLFRMMGREVRTREYQVADLA